MIRRLPDPNARSKMGTMGGASDKHPGKITFVNADTGTSNVLDASAVPEQIRWADTPKGRVPVVRVVASTSGDKRTIQEYGTDGQILRSTVQIKS